VDQEFRPSQQAGEHRGIAVGGAGGAGVVSIIDVPLNKDCTAGSSVTANKHEHRVKGKPCQEAVTI
jgi:hypothetical protein